MPLLHRRLALRLGLGALLISMFAGLATLYIELARVDDTILSLAIQEAETFVEKSPGAITLDRAESISAKLQETLEVRKSERQGHFFMAEVYDAQHREVAQAGGHLPAEVEKQIDTDAHRFPTDGLPKHRKIVSGEKVFLQVLVPLTTGADQVNGVFEGVFAVPTQELHFIKGRVVASVLMVMAVVAMTALALYPIIIGLHREQAQLSRNLLKSNLDTLAVLGSAIAKRDSDTHAHNFRVTLYALGLAEKYGLKGQTIRELIKGSWLHDVGKIAISDTILLKPGKLTDQEFAIMKSHVAHGLDIVGQSSWLEEAALVIGGHHEKWDGSGYPNGLAGEEIPLNARIFALADVFDALTSRRPYKDPMSAEQALDIMRKGRGSHFDPTLFDLFAQTVFNDYAAFGGSEDDRARRLLLTRGQRYFFDA